MQPGRVLSDRYELVERLGSGGMAEVFLARDRILDRDVAVKVLLAGSTIDDDLVRRFRREARSAASLSHPNVVSIHDTGTEETGTGEDIHFIVMELIDGATLETVIAERAPLPVDEVVDVVDDVCRALEVAHDAGLVHRDIKPGNIMFDASGEVKVTDFGIALVSAATRLTRGSDIFGSAAYLAPEQARGGDVDGRADLYALGCVMYEMLTGQAPFTGAEPLSIVYQHLHGDLDPPSTLRDGLSSQLDTVVMGMLARHPDDRYGSAREVREELDRLRSTGALASAGAITATERLEPDETVAMSRAASTDDATPPTPVPAGSERDGSDEDRRWQVGLAVVAALVVLAALLAATVLRSDGAPDPLAATPLGEGTPSPEPTPSPTLTPSSPMSLEEAVIGLYGTVVTGQEQGELSEKAAEDLRKLGEEALEKYREGETEDALKKLDEGRKKVAERTREGEIAPARADAVLAAIDQVEQALQRAAPPPDGGEGKNEGEGDGDEAEGDD